MKCLSDCPRLILLEQIIYLLGTSFVTPCLSSKLRRTDIVLWNKRGIYQSIINFWLKDFSTPSFNPRPFNPRFLNHELFNPGLWFKNSWLKSPGLESSQLKNLGLKGPGLKFRVEKFRIEMSFIQCGVLTFNDEVFRGCMYTCQDNMCNQASPILKSRIHVFFLYLMFLFV